MRYKSKVAATFARQHITRCTPETPVPGPGEDGWNSPPQEDEQIWTIEDFFPIPFLIILVDLCITRLHACKVHWGDNIIVEFITKTWKHLSVCLNIVKCLGPRVCRCTCVHDVLMNNVSGCGCFRYFVVMFEVNKDDSRCILHLLDFFTRVVMGDEVVVVICSLPDMEMGAWKYGWNVNLKRPARSDIDRPTAKSSWVHTILGLCSKHV